MKKEMPSENKVKFNEQSIPALLVGNKADMLNEDELKKAQEDLMAKVGEQKYADGLCDDIMDLVLLDDRRNFKFCYKTHYGSDNSYDRDRQEYKEDYGDPLIDGISGGNSTDRIIRCENIDKRWFWNHLHAFKQRIAIVDERLSYKIYGVDGRSFEIGHDSVAAGKKTASFLKDRNVWVFNIVWNQKSDEFIVYGMNERWVDDEDRYLISCRRVASIAKKKNMTGFLVDIDDVFKSSFDMISIHQGLLDKLYTKFNIKTDCNQKEILTKELHMAFCNTERRSAIDMGEGRFYLPGMTIHSGRSKPAFVDMPQKQPFIQYASLEHAVMDCKYVLVDLLERAYYE